MRVGLESVKQMVLKGESLKKIGKDDLDMKVDNRKMKVRALLAAILVFGFIGAYFYANNGRQGNEILSETGQTYLFVNPVLAQSSTTGTTFLEQEAGMTIYVNTGASIDLSTAKSVYKTIEKETSEYIVGSLSLPDLPETDDVHCFVHKDGWIVVYYLKAESISKIIDWNYYSGGKLTKTKLQLGLEKMGLALNTTTTDAKYYNFQYPYANKWMIIIEIQDGQGTDSFNLKIPSEFTFYERSWTHNTAYGTLTGTQLSPDVFHTVTAEVGYSWGYYSYLRIDGNVINSQSTSASKVAIVLAYKET